MFMLRERDLQKLELLYPVCIGSGILPTCALFRLFQQVEKGRSCYLIRVDLFTALTSLRFMIRLLFSSLIISLIPVISGRITVITFRKIFNIIIT